MTELSDLIAIARRRVWLIVASTVIFASLAAIVGLGDIPRYRATAVLRAGGARAAVTEGIETQLTQFDRFANPLLSQTQLLRSRSLLSEVVDSVGFRLRPDYGEFPIGLLRSVRVAPSTAADTMWLEFDPVGLTVRTRRSETRGAYGQLVSVDGVEFTVDQAPSIPEAVWTIHRPQVAVDRLLADLRVSPRPETNIVDVSFAHPDPATAQLLVNTLVVLYRHFETRFAQERARQRRIFLEEQVAQTDSSLAQAQSALRGYQTSAQTYDARLELEAQQQNRMVLDIRREELDAERGMYQGLLDRLDASSGEARWDILRTLVSSPGIAGNPAVARLHQQLMDQRAALDLLTTGDLGSSESNPDVIRQRQLIATSESDLTSAIRSHVSSLDARSLALSELTQRTADELSTIPYQMAEEARLSQFVQTYQAMSDQLREEYQKARMAEAAAVGQADIVDLADLPYQAEPGRRLTLIVLGLAFGMILGSGVAFVLERRIRSVQTREELEETFGLAVLGSIPEAAAPDLAVLQGRPSGHGTHATDDSDGSQSAHAAEAYRMLRTNFMFAGWTGDIRSIVVTSSAPREGKTLTATNLAVSIAEEGARVLLVDADLWRGRIHKMFNVPESPGFGDLLEGTSQGRNGIRATGVPGLHFLPRGTRRDTPSALARRAVLSELLDRLAEDYDAVVIDAPPVLAAGSAPVLAGVADGVLFLVRAGHTDREALREALRELETVDARILGAVLNDPENMSFAVARKYQYQYEYATD